MKANTEKDVGEEGAMFIEEALRMNKSLFSRGLKSNSTLTSLDLSGRMECGREKEMRKYNNGLLDRRREQCRIGRCDDN